MPVLSHPSIQDGWFREINPQWAGQAMTLKVNKILHVEKSLYQDVLVFESETYGNVLVLDGVIQCTERDEFSYQEMIAHIPLNSHPNPTDVLVIGGGDGGVVREVLRHSSVKNVVLCDIDEAVIRVSKLYLPHMSSVFDDPRVTVFVGDGFKFLQEHEGTYDVIVTDSSDPVGPAQALFEKPYFQLLRDALKDGGSISTQGECLWVHLPLITELRTMAQSLFPVAEYAFTTIPTYPAGQIGFMVCSKDASRDLSKPLRQVPGTIYYNNDVHKAAFVLPEFGKSMLNSKKNILPVLKKGANLQAKKVLLLGSGYVARPCADFLTRTADVHVTIACRTLKAAQALADSLPDGQVTPISLDVNDTPALEKAVAENDLVISLIPYTFHAAVAKAGIKGKTNVLTTSYISPALRELDDQAKAAGICIFNEIGVDPGVDHLYAIKTIEEVKAKGGKIKKFFSYCGGLPAPQFADNPLGYKFSWSPKGVLLASGNPASWLENGQKQDISGTDLMSIAKPYYISPAYGFVAYPNRDSTPFREFYRIPDAEHIVRGTLRYAVFPSFITTLNKIGFLNQDVVDWLKDGLVWSEVTKKVLGAKDSEDVTLVEKVKEIVGGFPSPEEEERIVSGLRWIGLFNGELKITPRNNTVVDTLCARLEDIMGFSEGERDILMLQHKFVVEWQDGKTQTLTSTLEHYGAPTSLRDPTAYSAMALLVGIPCGIAARMILNGEPLLTRPGVHGPYDPAVAAILREACENEGIGMVEKVL
ncbi:saccharopine dehydrogenase [Flagelloscypha sp. PMI_526]|nr:saccharopine dehydrogenase [Flagelloscypha sp. PMI_526]